MQRHQHEADLLSSFAPIVEGKSGEALEERLWSELMVELSFADAEGIVERMRA